MKRQTEELNAKSEDELRAELKSVRRALFGLKVSLTNQASENVSGIGKLRKDIARIKTVLRQRQGAAAAKEEQA